MSQNEKSPPGNYQFNELKPYRTAVKFTEKKAKEFRTPKIGFNWDTNDAETEKWRPQGITGIKRNDKSYILVSWYGRKGYEGRGGRISIVDISDMNDIKYSHLLLVHGPALTPFANAHVGGIAVYNNHLHVTAGKTIRVFDLNHIKAVSKEDAVYKYQYLMIEQFNYSVPTKASFISYDKTVDKMLIGEFKKSPSASSPSDFTWYKPPSKPNDYSTIKNIMKAQIYSLNHEIKKIQGMASTIVGGKRILWLSTSWGGGNRSNLYSLEIDKDTPEKKVYGNIVPKKSSSMKYPPGLEDCYISPDNLLWTCTEFSWGWDTYK
ncbi:MAG: hypothetical protein AAF570_06335, partial [Bacteroidota bacterium]